MSVPWKLCYNPFLIFCAFPQSQTESLSPKMTPSDPHSQHSCLGDSPFTSDLGRPVTRINQENVGGMTGPTPASKRL